MKLQFLIPMYKESFEVVKPLLDSIALQQNVDFNEIGVIIRCDGGTEITVPENLYPFRIDYKMCEHRGVSATRNACLDDATADYVMFCDCDDMFYNMCGLWIIFREMEVGFDSFVSVFIEETINPQTKEHIYINREMDSTFVHGKVHRRKYLLEKISIGMILLQFMKIAISIFCVKNVRKTLSIVSLRSIYGSGETNRFVDTIHFIF